MNYGLNLEREARERKPEDWLLGAAPTCVALVPMAEREKCLPAGEVQKGREDFMDCASRAPLNILETKLNWLLRNGSLPPTHKEFLTKNGYITKDGVRLSDAFTAIKSGTTRQGNSLISPLHSIHKHGFIPKKMLPAEKWMTFDEYHNPKRITDAMTRLGLESLTYFTVNYERVYEEQFKTLLEEDMLDVGGFAWMNPVDGEYRRTDFAPNHAFVAFNLPAYSIFDNYIAQNSFIKKLASDYDLLDYGYRLIISLKPYPKADAPESGGRFTRSCASICRALKAWWGDILAAYV